MCTHLKLGFLRLSKSVLTCSNLIKENWKTAWRGKGGWVVGDGIKPNIETTFKIRVSCCRIFELSIFLTSSIDWFLSNLADYHFLAE